MSGRKPMSSIRSASSRTTNELVAQFKVPRRHVVQDAARGADDDVDARVEASRSGSRSACRRRWRRCILAAVRPACRLRREPGRPIRGWAPGPGLRSLRGRLELLQDRDRERRGLAGAGTGLAHTVDPLHRPGNQARLDRRRLGRSRACCRAARITSDSPEVDETRNRCRCRGVGQVDFGSPGSPRICTGHNRSTASGFRQTSANPCRRLLTDPPPLRTDRRALTIRWPMFTPQEPTRGRRSS